MSDSGSGAVASVDTDELAVRVDNDPPFILDVRAPEQFEKWQIEGKAAFDTVNIPYWTAFENPDEMLSVLPEDKDVIVVCAHGGSSELVVEELNLPNLKNLAGGMNAWSRTLVPHELWNEPGQFVVQFDRIAKACLSYVVGEAGKQMAVIDPAADFDVYIRYAEAHGCTITDVFDTHLHADHVSIGRALAARTGSTYHISAGDAEDAVFEYQPLEDGETFHFGDLEVIVRSVATPGHTPGSTSLEVAGRFLMTGDAVFVSGVGRPDLGGATDPWARDLFKTVHERLAPLDPDLDVCPAHYTSRSESGADGSIRRKLGDLLTNDPVVSMADEDEFVAYVVEHLGEAPAVYDEIRKVNLGLVEADDEKIQELEVGRNECALSG